MGEKELHVDLHRLLAQVDRLHAGLNIIREYPTCVPYIRGSSGDEYRRLIRDDDKGTLGHHDIIVKRGTEKIAIELFHGRDYTLSNEDFTPVNLSDELFFLRPCTVSPKWSKIHLDNDCTKITDLIQHNGAETLGSVLMFVSAFHRGEKRKKAFLRNKRKPILEHIASKTKTLPNGIDIWYIERAYTRDSSNGSCFIHLPTGEEYSDEQALNELGL